MKKSITKKTLLYLFFTQCNAIDIPPRTKPVNMFSENHYCTVQNFPFQLLCKTRPTHQNLLSFRPHETNFKPTLENPKTTPNAAALGAMA